MKYFEKMKKKINTLYSFILAHKIVSLIFSTPEKLRSKDDNLLEKGFRSGLFHIFHDAGKFKQVFTLFTLLSFTGE